MKNQIHPTISAPVSKTPSPAWTNSVTRSSRRTGTRVLVGVTCGVVSAGAGAGGSWPDWHAVVSWSREPATSTTWPTTCGASRSTAFTQPLIPEGGRDREHLDGRIDLPLCARRAEPCLRLVLPGSHRRQQRRDDDPARRSRPPPPGAALDPPGSLHPQCPQHRGEQDRRRTLPGPQPGRRSDRRGLRHSHPACGLAELRPVRQHRRCAGWHQHVLPVSVFDWAPTGAAPMATNR